MACVSECNAPHGRDVLAARVAFAHQGEQWRDRVCAHRAIAYRIHEDVVQGRWYLTASWTIPPATSCPWRRSGRAGWSGWT